MTTEPSVPRSGGMLPSLSVKKGDKAHGFEPDYFARTIEAIDVAVLRQRGVRYLVLDVDHTLAPYNALELSSQTRAYLHTVKQDLGIERIYLASNSRRDLTAIATSIDAVVIRSTLFRRKPRKVFFMNVLAIIKCRPLEVAMVGDKLIPDIWGANRVGMVTILVDPIGRDVFLDRMLLRRFWKQWYLKRTQL